MANKCTISKEQNGYRHLNDTDKFLHVPTELQVINLGSSHGLNGFDYSEASIKGYNMALAAQGFYYDYRILKQYSSHLVDEAVVLLPISYFHHIKNTKVTSLINLINVIIVF